MPVKRGRKTASRKTPVKSTKRRKRRFYKKETVIDNVINSLIILSGVIVGSVAGGMIPLENEKIKSALIASAGVMLGTSNLSKNKMLKPFLTGISAIGMYSFSKQFINLPVLQGNGMGVPVIAGSLGTPVYASGMSGGASDLESEFFTTQKDFM